ncbi:MAG: HlyD family efflux transporter periplasmic adaptor subunit, partial [Lachnospiraceae bacterium]|nr:HlyD family efflux transporter periplasmic adaptor subunit [Lachnospiraceae bacterium]
MADKKLRKKKEPLFSRKVLVGAVCIALAVILVAAVVMNSLNSSEEVAYRETTVEYGSLVVGITESGSVEIGTQDQVFEMDLSELVRASTSSSSSSSGSSGGGMDSMGGGGGGSDASSVFSQIFSMSGSSGSSSSSTIGDLTVAEVAVSVGQEVSVGDTLYVLEEDTVTELREQLEENVEAALADLELVYADQESSRLSAEYTYQSSILYGTYAQTEYDNSVKSLQDAVTEAEENLADAQELLTEYEEELASIQLAYEQAQLLVDTLEYRVENNDKWEGSYNAYNYAVTFQQWKEAQTYLADYESEVESLTEKIEQAQSSVTSYTQQLANAQSSLATGMLTAKETYDLRMLAYNTAQETYDIAIAYLEDAAADQEETYENAVEILASFDSYISGNEILSDYNGVVTSVALEVGDNVTTNTTLVTLYDLDEVTMTVAVDEDDMTDIELGGAVNISFTAYPDDIYQAEVTEISDAYYDSSSNVVYDVTVTITSDASGLFQGMTGDVTFVTKESEEVLYVSNRAIIRSGTKSYVKMRDSSGNVTQVEGTNGFSDGVYVEIIEGLSE